MDCGIPFCMTGCPVNNIIPDWNDLVYQQDWKTRDRDAALDQQLSRVHRPHLPGAVRGSLRAAHQRRSGRHQVDRARDHRQGLGRRLGARRSRAAHKTGKRVAVVGSGPAGLACAQQLARAGHDVTVFEKNDRIGGLLRYGIPDFKLEKCVIDRRLEQMRAEGVKFRTSVFVGTQRPVRRRQRCRESISPRRSAGRVRRGRARAAAPSSRATCRSRAASSPACTSRWTSCRCRTSASPATQDVPDLWATGKHVVIIGGGDTGSDCVGTSNRHGAKSVTQFELLPMPPDLDQQPGVALLADASAHLVLARGRRQPRLGDRHQALRSAKTARSRR